MTAPLIVLGDGWQNPTGLARIARDLHAVLAEEFQPHHVGYHPPAVVVGSDADARRWSFSHLGEDWGASTVIDWITERFDPQAPGVLLIVWDPDRASHYVRLARRYLPGWELWGYFAIDGHNRIGKIGDPASFAVHQFDRVLGYTSYGAGVLSRTCSKEIAWLPHGHAIKQPPYFDSTVLDRLHPRYARAGAGAYMIGCVATNQARKDMGLFVETLAALRASGEQAYGWLHTDELVKAWDIPQLIGIYSMQKYLRVTTGQLSDEQLQQCYQGCRVTVCIGRGEGFGYPIVESLACGTPCLSMDYAGGAEITPREFRYPWQGADYTNRYAIGRPLANVQQVAEMVRQIARQEDRQETAAYCRGSVAHLHWDSLRGRWQDWVREGMEGL
jgi:glycosyltransferase involved in cell wall biosynthesis